MKDYVELSMKVVKLNPLHYVTLPGYSFDCWLISSGTILDTLQDKQMLDDFIEANRGVMCGIRGDRLVNTRESNKATYYIDAKTYMAMQGCKSNLTKNSSTYFITSLDDRINTPDDSDYGY